MIDRLKQYLIKGEGDMLDYKQEITSAHKIAKTMVSFANHKGGILLVGVRDNRTIAGIRTEDEKYMLDLAASFYCKPEITLEITEHQIGDKVVLECNVPEGDKKPYYAKGEDEKWWVYVRVNDNCILASKTTVDFMHAQKKGGKVTLGKIEQGILNYLKENNLEENTIIKHSKSYYLDQRLCKLSCIR